MDRIATGIPRPLRVAGLAVLLAGLAVGCIRGPTGPGGDDDETDEGDDDDDILAHVHFADAPAPFARAEAGVTFSPEPPPSAGS